MKRIGTLFLTVALLIPTGASLSTVSANDSTTVPAPRESERLTLWRPSIIRFCDGIKQEYSLSFIPITLCFYLFNQEGKKDDSKPGIEQKPGVEQKPGATKPFLVPR